MRFLLGILLAAALITGVDVVKTVDSVKTLAGHRSGGTLDVACNDPKHEEEEARETKKKQKVADREVGGGITTAATKGVGVTDHKQTLANNVVKRRIAVKSRMGQPRVAIKGVMDHVSRV